MDIHAQAMDAATELAKEVLKAIFFGIEDLPLYGVVFIAFIRFLEGRYKIYQHDMHGSRQVETW